MTRAMSDRTLTIYCGCLMAVGAFSIDITLPFFGVLREAFNTTNDAVYATITLNIVGLGVGQLFFGSIADRFGRRPAIAAGLAIFLLAVVCAALAPNIEWLLAARLLQGFGGGAAPVAARAMIRDRFHGPKLGQNMAIASGIFSIGPIAAPLCGALMIEAGFSWRVVFIAMAVLAVTLMLVLLRTPETLAEPRRDALSAGAIARNIRAIFANAQSRFFLLLGALTMINIILVISGTAVIMENAFGVTGIEFALFFAVHGLGIIAGQFLNHFLIGRFGIVPAALAGASIISVALLGVVIFTALDSLNVWGFAAGITVFAVGYLMVFANAASMTLEPHGRSAGFTAAFYGSMTQLISAVIGTVLVSLAGGELLAWSTTLLGVCLATLAGVCLWLLTESRRAVRANA